MNIEQQAAIYDSWTLSQLAEEAINAADAAVRNSRAAVVQAVNAGRLLIAAKAQVQHGQWKQWLEDNWQGEGRGYETAVNYIRLAKSEIDISDATSIRQALRMLAEAKMERAPFLDDTRRQHAAISEPTPAANLTPEDVPNPEPQVTSPADRAPPQRPTPTKVAKATKKKVDKGKPGRPTKPVHQPPVITEDQIFTTLEKLPGSDADKKRLAQRARQLANKWDPPRTGKFPTVEEVREYASERGWTGFDAEKFWNHYEMKGWKLKGGRLISKWKSAAANAWDKGKGWCAAAADSRVYTSHRAPMEFEEIQ